MQVKLPASIKHDSPDARTPVVVSASAGSAAPELSVERWALDYIASCDLSYKLSPPPPPNSWSHSHHSAPAHPGRPHELRVTDGSRQPRAAKRSPVARAKLIHTFFHHELQAAELMCWAIVRFPDAPLGWRRGTLSICLDEIRHMSLYADYLEHTGHAVGSFPVRDWFWERVPTCQSPLQFIALMNLGLEAANLEHAHRFADAFRAAGDFDAARIQEQVETEEIAHVAFGRHWFEQLAGELEFERWMKELPAPLSPLLMRGTPLNRSARQEAGLPEAFLDALQVWQPDTPGPSI